jgi:hypothetical protein
MKRCGPDPLENIDGDSFWKDNRKLLVDQHGYRDHTIVSSPVFQLSAEPELLHPAPFHDSEDLRQGILWAVCDEVASLDQETLSHGGGEPGRHPGRGPLR